MSFVDWKSRRGSALLVVVIIMSLLFMLASIVFGYVLREYRYGYDRRETIVAKMQTDTSVSDALTQICLMIDEDQAIGTFDMNRSFINGDPSLGYEITVYEDGTYSGSEFRPTSNRKVYRIKRNLPEPLPDPVPEVNITAIAVDILNRKDASKFSRKLLVDVTSTLPEYYDVVVYEAY